MRKLSKPAIIITIGVITAALLVSVAIGVLMKNSKKTRISQLEITKKQAAKKNTGLVERNENDPLVIDDKKKDDSTIGNAIKKEQQMLKESEKGGYVGGVGPSKKKKNDPDLEGMIIPESKEDTFPAKKRKVQPNIYNDTTSDTDKVLDGDNEQIRKKTWEYLYLRKVSGAFLNNTRSAANNTSANVTANIKESGGEKNPPLAGQTPKVQYFRPYRAVIDRTFTSADTKAVFVATGNEIPLKGWKIIGKASPNFTDNRFHIEVSGVLSLDNIHYAMKGYAASIDQSDGIISKVRHDDIGGTMTSSILSGMSSFLNALRKDTTTIEVASGTTVTGQTKDDDRLREAGLASGDTMFQGMAKKAESSAKKTPTLIMEKSVPVLIYFTP